MAEDQNVHSIYRTLLGLSASEQPMETNALLRAVATRLVEAGVSFSTAGQVFINDTSNANVTRGLTINQGAADNSILALKSSDVAHGMTDVTETDTYAEALKVSAGGGGVYLRGFSSSTTGMRLHALHTTDDATRSTSAVGAVIVDGSLKTGTNVTPLGANTNIFIVRNSGTARFILDSDGDSHQDVGTAWTEFDAYDDAGLLDSLNAAVQNRDPLREGFGAFVRYNRAALERAKLVTFNDDGHHFVNMSRLTMLLTGAVRQIGERQRLLQARIDRLERQTWAQRALGWLKQRVLNVSHGELMNHGR